jgi:hypothetical protein
VLKKTFFQTILRVKKAVVLVLIHLQRDVIGLQPSVESLRWNYFLERVDLCGFSMGYFSSILLFCIIHPDSTLHIKNQKEWLSNFTRLNTPLHKPLRNSHTLHFGWKSVLDDIFKSHFQIKVVLFCVVENGLCSLSKLIIFLLLLIMHILQNSPWRIWVKN